MPIRSQFETEAEWLDHLRSWFAGQAIADILATVHPMSIEQEANAKLAGMAYAIADAMLAERSKDKV